MLRYTYPWMKARVQVETHVVNDQTNAEPQQADTSAVDAAIPHPKQPAESPPKQIYEHQQHLRQHCVVCARWIVDPTALKRHLKQAHKEVWQKIAQELESQCATTKGDLIRDEICQYCDRTSYNRCHRQSNVIFQSAIAGLFHSFSDDRSGDPHLDVQSSASGAGLPDSENSNADAAAAPGQRSQKKTPNKAGDPHRPEQQQGEIVADSLPLDGPGSAARGCAQSGSA